MNGHGVHQLAMSGSDDLMPDLTLGGPVRAYSREVRVVVVADVRRFEPDPLRSTT